MHQDHQPSKPFDDFRNIEVGLARVIYEGDSWYGLTGWRIPGGRMTQDRDEAHRCAVAMNTLMGGVEVVREPQTREFKTIRPDLSDPAPLVRMVRDMAKHAGLSGEDQMTILAYHALLGYEKSMDMMLDQAMLSPFQAKPAQDAKQ